MHADSGIDATTADDIASETDVEADAPPRVINQIALANARGPIESIAAVPADVDVEAVPTFATADDSTTTSDVDRLNADAGSADHVVSELTGRLEGGDSVGAPGDDANEAAVS